MATDPGVTGERNTLDDPLAESLRLVEVADARGLTLRLMGGMAVRAHAPRWPASDPPDRGGPRLRHDLEGPCRRLRAARGGGLHARQATERAVRPAAGATSSTIPRKRPVDVLVDKLEMCHRIEFGDRLGKVAPTLPLAELLLSKLQVVKINKKDVLDALILLAEHPLGPGRR